MTALASFALLALVTVGCGSDDDADASSPDDQVNWQDCGGGQCAQVEVPLDHDNPDGEKITLDVARAPATGDRIGALFVNPGGPGGKASDFALGLAYALPDINERFDIVGVDPRGMGSSEIACGGDFVELYSVDYSIDSPEDEETLLDISQQYVDGCERAAGDMLSHMGTFDVAQDIDTVRELMGEEQISYLGVSYGTSIGQVYAQEFPDRVRAMVLDAVVETGLPGVETAKEQALGFEVALQSFADWCDNSDDCPIAPDAIGAIDDLSRRVEEEPIPGGSRPLKPGDLALALAEPLYLQSSWPSLAEAVAKALDGDGSEMVDLADEYLGLASFDIYFAVNCLDSVWPETPEEHLAAGTEAAEEAPHFGSPIVNDYVRCAMWPVEAQPLPEVTAPGTPPILVISTTNDPATPYQSGVDVAERLESGVLLTNEGDGHGVVGGGKPCIDEAITKYVVDLDPPEDDTTCEAD